MRPERQAATGTKTSSSKTTARSQQNVFPSIISRSTGTVDAVAREPLWLCENTPKTLSALWTGARRERSPCVSLAVASDCKPGGSRYLNRIDPRGDGLTTVPAGEPSLQAPEISPPESVLRGLPKRRL